MIQVDFEGCIENTHLSDDKKDLYVLIKYPHIHEIEIHVLNLLRLCTYKIAMIFGNYTHIYVFEN